MTFSIGAPSQDGRSWGVAIASRLLAVDDTLRAHLEVTAGPDRVDRRVMALVRAEVPA